MAAALDDDLGARIILDTSATIKPIETALRPPASDRLVFNFAHTFWNGMVSFYVIKNRWIYMEELTPADIIRQLSEFGNLVFVQILKNVVKEFRLLEWIAYVLNGLARDEILCDFGPQLVAQPAGPPDSAFSAPVNFRIPTVVVLAAVVLVHVDINPLGAAGHIDNGQVVIQISATIAAEVDLGSGVPGAFLRPPAASVSVAMAASAPSVVGLGDGGDGSTTGIAAFTKVEIVVRVFSVQARP